MKRLLCVLFLSIIIFFSTINCNALEKSKKQNVLWISSYHSDFMTYQDQRDGILSVLDYKSYNLSTFFMDFKRFPGDLAYRQFEESVAYKLEKMPKFDALIVSDDYALIFAMEHFEMYFSDIPIVFLGVNNVENAKIANEKYGMTGVIEAVSIKETIELALKLQPKAKKIMAIVDSTPSGQGDLDSFYKIESDFLDLSFEKLSLEDYSFSEFSQKLAEIKEDTILILLSAYHDKEGQSLNFYESVSLMVENSNVPIYHLWAHGIGEGLLGGKIISQYQQAESAAWILSNLLNYEIKEDIEVMTSSPNEYLIDYDVLREYNLNARLLPEDTKFINEPVPLLLRNKILLYTILGFLFLLVIVLIITMVIKNKEEKKLVLLNESYKETNQLLEEEMEERINTEEKLIIMKQKAEKANNSKSIFLANMSHEIRTPLNGIIGLTDLLLLDDIDSQKRHFLSLIKDSSLSLLEILNDILDYAKINSGKMDLNKNMFSLNHICNEVIKLFMAKADQKNIPLEYVSCDDTPEFLYGDGLKIKQVLSNLVGNALKFTDEGSVIIKSEVLNETDDDVLFEISVKDTGIGIDPLEIDDLFTRYTQKNDASETKGTGLGLAISKSIIELMEGKIWVESELGKGSVFSFVLKLPKYRPIYSNDLDENHQKVVLLFTTDILFKRILIKLLNRFNVKLIMTDQKDEVNKIINALDISLIIVDFLEVKDVSEEDIEILKRNNSKLKILLIETDTYDYSNLELVIDSKIKKPIDTENFYDKLNELGFTKLNQNELDKNIDS